MTHTPTISGVSEAEPTTSTDTRSWREVARVFVVIGFLGFGGPAAHIALMRDAVVRRRGWVDDRTFLDLVGACALVPGPNSTELALYLGLRRAGWRGLVAAAVGFILPAVVIVLAIAALYERYGATPTALDLSAGVVPVIVAIVAHAVVGLARTAVDGFATGVVALGSAVLWLVGANELLLLAASAIVVVAIRHRPRSINRASAMVPLLALASADLDPQRDVELLRLGWVFLKIGAVLYGSGYVLITFLEHDLVERLSWLTERQLLDAVAVGQFTPGPVFTTATFVGYQVAGVPGAVLATIAIFAPAFVFVAFLAQITQRVRNSARASSALDGITASSLGLMAAVGVRLADSALVDITTWVLAIASLVVLIAWKPNTAWLVLCGAVVGLARHAIDG